MSSYDRFKYATSSLDLINKDVINKIDTQSRMSDISRKSIIKNERSAPRSKGIECLLSSKYYVIL